MLPLAICGNIFTLTAVVMVLKLKTSIPNLLIGVLACTDIFSILTCHVVSIVSMAEGHYAANSAVCKFQSMMTYSYFKMGFLTKCCISLDRYIALTFPLQYRKLITKRKVLAVTIHNILFSFGTSVLTIVLDGENISQLPTWYLCVNDFEIYTHYKRVIIVTEGAVFFLGVILFFVSNLTVIRVVVRLNKKTRELFSIGQLVDEQQAISHKDSAANGFSSSNGDSILYKKTDVATNGDEINGNNPVSLKKFESLNSVADGVKTDVLYQQENGSKDNISDVTRKTKKQQKELQLAKLTTVIVTVFVILWLPYMTVIYWEHHNRRQIHPLIEDIVIKLVFANCCINPILYGVFNANFRRAYVYYLRMLGFYFTCKLTSRPREQKQSIYVTE